MQVEPTQEHKWLSRFVGEWSYEIEAVMKPGEPPEKFTGTESVKRLGEIWIVAEGEGEMPGGATGATMYTLGFDPKLNKFVGVWVGSMMAYLWDYRGELNSAGDTLTMESEGPAFDGTDKITQYKDVHYFVSENERTLTGNILLEDGSWMPMMTCRYKRK